jgi:hypothetical protein
VEGKLFQPNLCLVKEVPLFIFGEVQFRVYVVMVKDVLDAKELEGEGDKENIVGRVTSLDHMKSTPKINPPGV